MTVVLGLDAAWTASEPSGVALVSGQQGEWSTVCVAPSYDTFLARAQGRPIDWNAARYCGSRPNVTELLAAAEHLAGTPPSVVSVDMPLARLPFQGRRVADRKVSRTFGARGCSTHSPTSARPGPLGVRLMADLDAAGYPLCCERTPFTDSTRATIEVYPHPALLVLLHRDFRVPFKVSKSLRFWPQLGVDQRIAKLLEQFRSIQLALARELGTEAVELPSAGQVNTLARLKRFEDALDAAVCAWIGTRFVEGSVEAYGDHTAAIWIPRPDWRLSGC